MKVSSYVKDETVFDELRMRTGTIDVELKFLKNFASGRAVRICY